ncbi:DUF397 domain-containing protein [Streptomyces sp. H10-C2]|uniref:DUF397 domain-containing protein n=1 Tax=Streptomyces TaxID=1883 RepID=UPI0018DFF6D8|nr:MULTISPECIES: DUF397 domain-containing protein [Streptomyces]MDJ0344222.1 DUF397 domain-containing protein [Streptomyces sp. PH10-H1]MDJ0373560.1 DUF397 domain-containing protein [Streptomyces sp. H10-C2]
MTPRTPPTITDPASLNWFKSTASSANGECIEIALAPGGVVGVRDSKDTGGPALAFTAGDFASFIAAVKAGHLDA